MKGLAIINIGVEDIAASEINELINASAQKRKACVAFGAKKIEDFFTLCYRLQSARKILLLLDEFNIKNIDDIKSHIQKINLDEWINEKTSFVVRSLIINNEISAKELEPKVGEFILGKIKSKVDVENPETTFFVFIENGSCCLGIDFSGKDLGKRDYRIFTGAEKLKPAVAYSLLRIAGFKKEDALLDPFCSSGTIPIEAALFALDFPVNYFSKDKFLFLKIRKFRDFDFEKFFEDEDKKIIPKQKTSITAADPSFQAITAAKKNAKIAGVIKSINFSRKEPKWLDVKFKEHTVGKIVSFPPQKTKFTNPKQIEKTYEVLFYQAEYILKEKGIVVLLLKETETAEKAAKKYKFKIKEKRTIMQGKESFEAVVFAKPL